MGIRALFSSEVTWEQTITQGLLKACSRTLFLTSRQFALQVWIPWSYSSCEGEIFQSLRELSEPELSIRSTIVSLQCPLNTFKLQYCVEQNTSMPSLVVTCSCLGRPTQAHAAQPDRSMSTEQQAANNTESVSHSRVPYVVVPREQVLCIG
jgi:hypothetical protein